MTLNASGPAYSSNATYKLTIGSKSADWTLTAQSPTAVTPTSFSLNSTIDEINQLITSNNITVGGLATGEVAQANLTLSGTLPSGASLLVNGVIKTQLPTIVNQGDQMNRNHVNAIEEGNTAFFKKSTQSLIWHARLYAKKFGVVLPELVFTDITRSSSTTSNPAQKIPAFLLKSISHTEPTKTNDGRN